MGQRARDERKRLERYLEWRRERGDEARVDRRSWLRHSGVALAFMLVIVGVLAWPTQNRPATQFSALPAVATKAAEVAAASPEPPSAPIARASIPVPEAAVARSRASTAESNAPSRVVRQARERAAREVGPSETTSSERAVRSVRAATLLQPPRVSDAPRAAAREIEPSGAAPAPRKSGTLIAKRSCADLPAGVRDSSGDGLTRTRRIADCLGGWLEGEAQEVRTAFNRELDEFRAGVDKVGRGLEWLGAKLRR